MIRRSFPSPQAMSMPHLVAAAMVPGRASVASPVYVTAYSLMASPLMMSVVAQGQGMSPRTWQLI